MDQIGYVTIAEADTYVEEHYLSTDPLRVLWEGLSESDKGALLRRSFQMLELLPFIGRKYECLQPNAFPRWPDETIPEGVKHAQIENALSNGDPDNAEEAAFYERLWKYGVQSYSIGNLSESISTGTYQRLGSASSGVLSSTALKLLQPYLSGGYRL